MTWQNEPPPTDFRGSRCMSRRNNPYLPAPSRAHYETSKQAPRSNSSWRALSEDKVSARDNNYNETTLSRASVDSDNGKLKVNMQMIEREVGCYKKEEGKS